MTEIDKMFKVCTKCRKEFHICCFNKDKSKRDGLRPSCNDCKAKSDREYKIRNRERVLLKLKQYRESHREELQEKSNIRYHSLDKKRENERRLNYNKKNPKKRQEVVAVNFANTKARRLNIPGRLEVEQWRQVKQESCHKCLCCGKQEPEISLTLDHIVPLVKGGWNTIKNVQPLCGYCNNSKGDKEISYACNSS